MPRKVDPHWGKNGYETDWLPVELNGDQTERLARSLGVDPSSSKADELREAITDIGNTYRRWKDRGAAAFSRAQARHALEELLTDGSIHTAALTALNERALQCLHNSLLMTKPPPVEGGDSVTAALFEGRLDEATLRRAVQGAVDRLKKRKGPDRDGELGWAVAELCRVYEEQTGRKATHSSKGKHMAYVQEPQSEAGRFVRQCFLLIDAKASAAKISGALRAFGERRG